MHCRIVLVIMATQRLPALTDDMRGAEFGRTYHELKGIYPNWAQELHDQGHVLDNDKLQTIFNEGLLLWYIKKECAPMHTTAQININTIKYYDFKGLLVIARKFGIDVPATLVPFENFGSFQQYKSSLYMYMGIKLRHGEHYDYMSFASLARTELLDDLTQLVTSIQEHCTNIMEHFGGDVIRGIQQLVIAHTELPKLGLIFQRFKVVLEKIEKLDVRTEEHVANMYKIDKLLELLQELMVSRIRRIVEGAENVILTGNFEELEIVLYDRTAYTGIYEFIFMATTGDESVLFHPVSDAVIMTSGAMRNLLSEFDLS